jgi:hypothetical protein
LAAKSLVVALGVVVAGELADQTAKVALAEDDEVVPSGKPSTRSCRLAAVEVEQSAET